MEDHIQWLGSEEVQQFAGNAGSFCSFLDDQEGKNRTDLVEGLHSLLAALYTGAAGLEAREPLLEDMLEDVVTESDWQRIERLTLENLGQHNEYLEVFDPRMAESVGPVTCSLAENMADIYQDLKNFITQYHLGSAEVMHDSLAACLENFRNYWGQSAANALRALHQLRYNTPGLDEDTSGPAEEARNTSGWIITRMQQQYRGKENGEES